jgi:hypothetical protein
MRRVPSSLALVLVAAAFATASPCRAEDPAPPAHPAAWKAPPFDKDTIAMRDDDAPEGWRVVDETRAAEKEIEAEVRAAVTAAAFPEGEASVGHRHLAGPDGAAATVAYVDFFQDPAKVVPPLKEAAAKKGWVVKEVTSPARLLVIAAPESCRDALAVHAGRMAAKRLAAAARAAATIQEDPEAATALAKAATSLEPKAAEAHLALAYVSRPRDPKAPGTAWKKSVEEMRAALAADAAFPLSEDDRVAALGDLGGFLLQSAGDDAVNREARDALTKALEGATKKDPKGAAAVGYRYNLACAYARLKDKDRAFEHLRGVLEVTTKTPVRGISGWWLKDPDLDVLKDDPRWKETVDKYPDSEPAPGGHDGGE